MHPMWIRKILRDRKKGVDSPMPTQVLSNEEFIPRPQSEKQKQVEFLIGEMAEQKSRKLGMDRPTFKARGGGILPSWLMAQSRDKINEFAKSRRALSQGNLAPNHYWDKTANAPD